MQFIKESSFVITALFQIWSLYKSMQSFSQFVSTIWCWWRGNWANSRTDQFRRGPERGGQGLNGFCWRIIIKHPHFRNTGLACCWLLPWKHKGSDLDTCFSIFKAFKPFHKPREGVSLVVKISGSKRILSWVAKISQFWSSQFAHCSYPCSPAQQQTVTGEMLSEFLLRSPLLLTTPTCKSSSKLHRMRSFIMR